MVPKMKRAARLLATIAFLAPVAAFGQVPGGDELAINRTPIIGGTTGRCLYDNAGKVGEQVCAGAATSITINTTTITGGTTTRVLYDNAGTIGEYTNAQLTALINVATASLSGALPAWPNNTTTFFRGDGTYATLNCAALGGSGAFCSSTDAANLTGTVASARLSGSYTGITGVGALAAGSAGAGFSIDLTAVTLTHAVPAANGGAGTVNGALKGNGSGAVSQAACADLSDGTTNCSAAVGQLPGTATNDNAAAGKVGEYRSASNADTGTAFGTSTVTITIASPAVVTWGTTTPFVCNGPPGNVAGAAVINFTTTGALPTGIVSGTNYYVICSSISGNSFQIATSAANAIAGTAINTSGTQSGTHTGAPTALLSSGVISNVAAMSLTAGDWDVDVDIAFLAGGTTSITLQGIGSSLVSATNDATPSRGVQFSTAAMVPGVSISSLHAGPARYSFSSTTTVFCIAQGSFTVSTLVAYGGCHARRVR